MELNERMALSIPDAAAASSLSRSFLYEELKAGRLKTVKIGGRRLVLQSDLRAFLESARAEAA